MAAPVLLRPDFDAEGLRALAKGARDPAQARWHTTKKRAVPANITRLPLPARSPDLNPVENLWQFLRDNWLGNRIFKSYPDILDHCCDAWDILIDRPWRIMSIGHRDWAHAC